MQGNQLEACVLVSWITSLHGAPNKLQALPTKAFDRAFKGVEKLSFPVATMKKEIRQTSSQSSDMR